MSSPINIPSFINKNFKPSSYEEKIKHLFPYTKSKKNDVILLHPSPPSSFENNSFENINNQLNNSGEILNDYGKNSFENNENEINNSSEILTNYVSCYFSSDSESETDYESDKEHEFTFETFLNVSRKLLELDL